MVASDISFHTLSFNPKDWLSRVVGGSLDLFNVICKQHQVYTEVIFKRYKNGEIDEAVICV